ncbi:hypothetical protein K488DRAFT_89925 [Vararia minispora EC-137]|uniref:Uncharacterized protein n=1 Tax=Vararia minispora EC-137 TaxID=1314806 RepID=A0ACB8Q8V5_9AGAM|nr:hypothetical protein K488DRAFT_89925 [Vararia minispora EC-137]
MHSKFLVAFLWVHFSPLGVASSASRGLTTCRRRCSTELTDDFSGGNCLLPQASSGLTSLSTVAVLYDACYDEEESSRT